MGIHRVLEETEIKQRVCFSFPDLLGTSVKETTDGSSQTEACCSYSCFFVGRENQLWVGAREGETILECKGILIIPIVILMVCSVVGCLGSCLEIKIQSCKLGSIKVAVFGNTQRNGLKKTFSQGSCLVMVLGPPLRTLGLVRRMGEGQEIKCRIALPWGCSAGKLP